MRLQFPERARSFDAWAGDYDRYRPGYPDVLFEEIRGRLALPSQPRVVDLGAGTGRASLAMVALGWRVTAVEPGKPMLDVLRAQATNQGLVLATVQATAESTGLESGRFQVVLCTQVLEHVTDPWAAAREIARLLPVGGQAVVSVPHVWFFHPHPRDHWRFTQQGLLQLVESAGLTPVSLLAQGGSVLALCQILNFLAYGAVGRKGAPLYAMLNAAAGADRLIRNDLFCLNFACLARKDG